MGTLSTTVAVACLLEALLIISDVTGLDINMPSKYGYHITLLEVPHDFLVLGFGFPTEYLRASSRAR